MISGPVPAQKIILRCKSCGINYRYDSFGGDTFGGYRFYDNENDLVKASNVCYIERALCEKWASAGHHCWTSFEGSAEVYNEWMRETNNYNYINLKYFLKKYNSVNLRANAVDDSQEQQTSQLLHRKSVASAWWTHQIEKELSEENHRSYIFSGPQAQENYMEEVDIKRANSVYKHENCSDECKKRGCGELWAIDGNWKLHYPVCMFDVDKSEDAFSNNLNYVKTCSNGPLPGNAFCSEHSEVMKKKGVPVTLKEYLNFKKHVQCFSGNVGVSVQSAAICQGTDSGIKSYAEFAKAVDQTEEVTATKTTCNKDTGEKPGTLQKWTRGTWFCVGAGGHIERWQPLYRSEGPAQVFMLVVMWLVCQFGTKGRDAWKTLTISYDNMCHLNNLRVSRLPLPLPND
ncbi:uncharacterized protein [Dysidea avara]|uniref:uncharacterized protein n=1 Tax=Dysidea avara TaxID=196820 RepID=UPI00331A907A